VVRSFLTRLICALALSAPAARAAETPAPAPAGLEFIENRGQWPAAVRYAAAVPGGRLFMENSGLTYALLEPIDFHRHQELRRHPRAQLRAQAVQLRFVGARAAALQPQETTGEVRNYLLGNDPKHWAAGVGGYRQLRYQGIWPGIDAHFYQNAQQQLEYDFELAAGADPAAVQLDYAGADDLSLRPDGALLVQTAVGTLTELPPQAYQLDAGGRRQPVSCRYVLQGHRVSFRLGRYDHSRPLTIDPTVIFATYTGSSAENWGFTATYDQQGNLYSGGIAFGPGYPASSGAYSTTFAGVIDVAIIKYNTAATGPAARLWATYLGGNQADFPESMVVNSQGELLILGTTSSLNYPVSATGYDRLFNGGPVVDPYNYGPAYELVNGADLFVTRLNAAGSALLGSTFLGGTNTDGLLDPQSPASPLVHNYGDTFRGDIIVDAADNVYLATNTASSDFPIVGGFRRSFGGGGSDGVVCKLNPALSSLLWSSFLGGSQADAAYSIQLAPGSGNIFVCGGTASNNFPVTSGSLFTQARGGVDGFVARISNDGTVLQRSSYLGTGSYDQAYFVQLDTNGDPYLLGQSLGSYPVTAGRYANSGSHQFIHKLNADLTTTAFSTVFGSGRTTIDISPTAFLVDQCDRIYASGWGGDDNSHYTTNGSTLGLPVSANAVQRTTDGGDFYLLALAPGATGLEYATYYGAVDLTVSDHVDGGTSRFDPRGAVYQSVCACGGAQWPIPAGAGSYHPGPPQTVYCNNAAFKFNFEISTAVAGADQRVCATAAPIRLGGSPVGGTWSGPGVSGDVANGFFFTPSPGLIGVQTLTYSYVSTGQCSSQASLRMTVTAVPTVSFTPLPQNTFCGISVTTPIYPLSATPPGGTFSGPGVSGSFFSVPAAGYGTHTLTYTYAQDGCTVQATQPVTVSPLPAISLGPDTALCAGSTQPIRLRASPAGGSWSGPNATAAGVFTPPPGFSGPVTLTYTVAGACSATATRRIGVVPLPLSVAFVTPLSCAADQQAPLRVQFRVATSNNNGNSPVTWHFGDSTSVVAPQSQLVEHTYEQAGTYRPRYTIRYGNELCSVSRPVEPVRVVARQPVPNVITPNGDDRNDVFVVTAGCPPRLQVFSRWGAKVYEAAAYANNWGGGTQPAGTYYYLLTFADGRTQKGWLEIVR
jgi:gliding motility-associated-like protein